MKNKIADELRNHYAKVFAQHQATAAGVNWVDEISARRRYKKVLELLNDDLRLVENPSILDVGCGYGGLLEFIKETSVSVRYTGIDLVESMIDTGKKNHPESTFILGDFMSLPDSQVYDYIICNGILMLKKDIWMTEMSRYTQQFVTKMFHMCRFGIAFNIHSSYVGWFEPSLFYKSPVEMLAYCLENLSTKIRLDHAYPHYDYTMFIYRDK